MDHSGEGSFTSGKQGIIRGLSGHGYYWYINSILNGQLSRSVIIRNIEKKSSNDQCPSHV